MSDRGISVIAAVVVCAVLVVTLAWAFSNVLTALRGSDPAVLSGFSMMLLATAMAVAVGGIGLAVALRLHRQPKSGPGDDSAGYRLDRGALGSGESESVVYLPSSRAGGVSTGSDIAPGHTRADAPSVDAGNRSSPVTSPDDIERVRQQLRDSIKRGYEDRED